MKKTYEVAKSDALLITDIQNDFLPDGALPVSGGDEIIPILNVYARRFEEAEASVFASKDWHPPNHVSFKQQGGPWPPHCVQDSKGAKFSPLLKLPEGAVVVFKATDPMRESYSVFDGTTFATELKERGIKRLFVGGLATDYCVLNTTLDARKLGYEIVILMDAIRGIDVEPGDVDQAIEKMLKAGAQQATTTDFPDAVDTLPMAETEADLMAEKPVGRAVVKKKARMRPRGAVKRIPTERRG
jgi:nicotinamidase/pyrazinamidase